MRLQPLPPSGGTPAIAFAEEVTADEVSGGGSVEYSADTGSNSGSDTGSSDTGSGSSSSGSSETMKITPSRWLFLQEVA